MGKQRRNRRKPHKENPTGLTSIKDCEESTEDVNEEDEDTAFQRAYDQVQSPKLEERISALQTLESMCCDKDKSLIIARSGVTKIIAPFLVDPQTALRAASASALRRIGEGGGCEAYEILVRDDVMTPLTALLKKYYTDWQPRGLEASSKSRLNDERDERETLIEAVTLLWSLCENNDFAMKPSNEEKLVSLLLKFLDSSTYGTSVSVVAAQCMLTLTEDNPSAVEELRQHESTLLCLLDLKPATERERCEIVPLRILAAGLLTNIHGDPTTDEAETSSVMCRVTSVIADTLAIDHTALIVELASMLPSERKANLSRNAKTKLGAAKKILEAQQQALELLANLCSEERDEEADSELDDSDTADYDCEPGIEDDPMNEKSFTISSSLPVALIEVIASTGLIGKVRDKTLKPESSVEEELNGHVDSKCVAKLIHTMRCRAFLCLNNLMANLDVDTLGGVDQLYRLWLEIGTTVFKDSDPDDIELLESATAAMRAALQKLAETRANNFETLTIDDIQPMLNGERQCSNPNVRANLIRVVGNLALILSPSDKFSELVKHVSVALLEICTRESEVWVMAEALDALMDIFAEDETDRMAGEIKLVEKLQTLVPVLINKIRQQKKSLGENASVVSTVKTNLTRFIKYKKLRIVNNS